MSPVLSRLIIAPLLVEFTREYPRIDVSSFLTESHVDIVGEGIDIAIRARHLEDSSLIASKLSSNPLMLAASPTYLENKTPVNGPEDLVEHECVTFSRLKAAQTWRFTQGKKTRDVVVDGRLSADQGDSLVQYAVAGAGIVMMPEWVMAAELKAGKLVRLLPEWSPPTIPLYLVYANTSVIPLRLRLLADFLRRMIRTRNLLPR